MKNVLQTLAAVLLVLGLLSLGPIIKYKNYKECRVHGFSKFYCVTH